jgi:hypothetical protein
MKRSFVCLLLAACSSAAPGSNAAPAPGFAVAPGDVVITDATVVTMARDGALAHHSVVVRGDRIVAVAPAGSLTVPSGATTIAGAGKWVMPGLADMHVHTWSDSELTMFIAAGVTTVRNMYGSDQQLAWRAQIARGERLGPTIVTAGPLIDGDPPVWPGSAKLTDPADADQLVAEHKAAGYDFLKPYSRLSRPAYEALAAAGQRAGMVLAGHVPTAVGLGGVLAAKQRSIEHLDGWLLALVPDGVTLPEGSSTAKLRAALPVLDAARLPGLIAQAIAAGTWNCPTLSVLDRVARLDDLAGLRRGARWLDLVAPAVVAQWDPGNDFRFQSMAASDYATMREANVWRAKVLAALVAAGAPIIAGTDTGNPYVIAGEGLHDELELMIAAGVPRARALRAATADAATYLGTPRELGIVDAGARADLLLVAVDPLTQPLPLVPDGVMLRGKWLPRADLDARLAAIAKQHHAPAPVDRFAGVPPLQTVGKVVYQARYDLLVGGRRVGEERLAVAQVGKQRTIVAQIAAELAGRVDVSYTLGLDATTIELTSGFGALTMIGKLANGRLVVTGSDLRGRPIALDKAVPPGGFLSATGGGGAIRLAERLAGMQVGDKRTGASIEAAYFPSPGTLTMSFEAERRPDAAGHQVFAVTSTAGKRVIASELVLDEAGQVVRYQLGPPRGLELVRRPR